MRSDIGQYDALFGPQLCHIFGKHMRDAINQMAVLVVWLWKDVCIVNGEIPVGAVAAAMSDG